MATPFPTYSDAIDVAQLQAAVVSVVASRVKGGGTSGTIPAGDSFFDVTLSFATPFASTPAVTATARTTADYSATVTARSAGGATVRLHRPAGASTAGAATVPFDWHATDLGNG